MNQETPARQSRGGFLFPEMGFIEGGCLGKLVVEVIKALKL